MQKKTLQVIDMKNSKFTLGSITNFNFNYIKKKIIKDAIIAEDKLAY